MQVAAFSRLIKSLTATNSSPGVSKITFQDALPILPKPFIAILFKMEPAFTYCFNYPVKLSN